jgi:hypothetical protein
MARKQGESAMKEKKRIITVSGSYIEGNVNIQHGDFVGGNQTKIELDIKKWLSPINDAISTRPKTTVKKRLELQTQVKEIEKELQKGEKAKPSFLVERLNNIKKTAPDIWEVALTTLINPPSGLILVVQKVAKKLAKEMKHKRGKEND